MEKPSFLKRQSWKLLFTQPNICRIFSQFHENIFNIPCTFANGRNTHFLNYETSRYLIIFLFLTALCKSGTRNLKSGTSGPGARDTPQSLKLGPGTPQRFKNGTHSKFERRTPGPPSKFKCGTPETILFD